MASGSTADAKSISSDMNDFLDYFYKILTENSIVITESNESDSSQKSVDTSDATYKSSGSIWINWILETISIVRRKFTKNWLTMALIY